MRAGRILIVSRSVSRCRITTWRPLASRLLVGAALLVAGPLHAQGPFDGVRQDIATWWETASRVAPGHWGIAIADQSGKLIWSVDPDDALIPASTVKLFTTGFARSILGSDARRPTRVLGTGWVDKKTGAWVGDWSLELNGDVTLERSAAVGPSLFDLAEQLRGMGIRRLSGPLQVSSETGDADAIWPSVWSPRHKGRLFAPLIGPITLNENVVSFTVRPGARSGQHVQLAGAEPLGVGSLLRISARTVAGRRNRLRLTPQPDGGWLLSGTLGARAGARRFTRTAQSPRSVLHAVWASALTRAGIDWQEKGFPAPEVKEEPKVLAEVTSPTLDSVASEVNRRSLNIGAELLLQWAAGRGPEAPAALMAHIRRVAGDSADVHLVDGSGLSSEDRVAPSTFVEYLARFPLMQAGRDFAQLLPANGTGTLRKLKRGFPDQGVVRAKTGTLQDVATVVGYLGRPEGVLLLSLMYNGPRPHVARQQQWQLFRTLGGDGVVVPSAGDVVSEDSQYGGEDAAAAPDSTRP
jgi:D-alanyl-D-alanine carboxypeptidase/D-alanyl-D-alanine-endopeptidase (penicillin-binding protein 4)